jgi:general L-amino acid transport system permease protein
MATGAQSSYVRTEAVAPMPAPMRNRGIVGWVREHLLSSWLNIALTLVALLLLWWIVPPLLNFLIFHATWSGSDRTACIVTAERARAGACWPFVFERINFFVYGFYPISQRWRVDVFFALLAFGIVWLLALRAPFKRASAIYFFVVLPVLSVIFLLGFAPLGLSYVATSLWGGILVTIVVSAVGIVFSLPLGVILALGRRSKMPVVRLFSVIFIEFVRGVPLITVLFMASVMLPLFVPEAWSPDKLLRALIGVALFAAAYMAEVVRAGLQSIPRGQYEGAQALGLSYWKMMGLIILPQALKVTIPNIVNSYIALFKDTTLVFVVGIFDFLRTIEVARIDPKWATPVTSTTGYAFAAIFYFLCCWMMSRYARGVERRLATGYKR